MRLKSLLRVSVATMLSRILGFVRDMTTASYLGSGGMADAFFLAFRLPNMFRAIFAEGAFNASFVPIFSRKFTSSGVEGVRNADVQAFLNNMFACLASATFILVVLGECFMPTLLTIFAPGFLNDPAKMAASTLFARISFPYLLLISLASFFAAILNTLHVFFLSNLAPILLNIFMILGLLIWAGEHNAGLVLSWSVTAAGVAQLLFLYWAAKVQLGIHIHWVRPRWNEDIKKLLLLCVPGVLAACVTQVNMLALTVVVSAQDRGISWLYYADRIAQLPLALVGVAIGVVLLPDLSKRLHQEDHVGIRSSQNRAWLASFALAMPAAAGLIVLSYDIIQVLFERGAFNKYDTLATSRALVAYAWGLPAFIFIKVLMPSFFAREDTWTPLLISGGCVVASTLTAYLLFPYFEYIGCALALTVSSWINVVLLFTTLVKRQQTYADWRLLLPSICVVLGVIGMVVCLVLVKGKMATPSHWIGSALRLFGLMLVGFTAYVLSFLLSYHSGKRIYHNLIRSDGPAAQ